MKQRLFALVAAFFLALLLFACGKTQGEDIPENFVQSTEPAETELQLEYPSVPEGPVVLWEDDPPAPLAVSPNGTVLTAREDGLWSADFGKGGPTGWSSRLVGEEGAFRQVTDWESHILAISDRAGFAVDSEGRLWGFGADDTNGQLGLGDTADGQPVSAPEPVVLLEHVEKVALGGDLYTMAVQSDGSLWLWGTYAYPEASGRRIKTPLHVMKGVYKVSGTNGGAGLALARDGSLWALEQYADDAGTPSVSPVLLMEGIVALEGDLAIDASGWLWEFSQCPGEPILWRKIMGKAVRMGWCAGKGLAIDEGGALWQWDSAFSRKPFEPLLPAEPEKIAGQVARIVSGGSFPLFMAGEIGALWQYDPASVVKVMAVIGGDYGTSTLRGAEGVTTSSTEEVLFCASYEEGVVYWTRLAVFFNGGDYPDLSLTDLYRLTYRRFSPSGQEQIFRGGLERS